jgi:hypothetical protein
MESAVQKTMENLGVCTRIKFQALPIGVGLCWCVWGGGCGFGGAQGQPLLRRRTGRRRWTVKAQLAAQPFARMAPPPHANSVCR